MQVKRSRRWGSSSLTQPLVVQSALDDVINRPGRPELMAAHRVVPPPNPPASSQGGPPSAPQARRTRQCRFYSGRRVKERCSSEPAQSAWWSPLSERNKNSWSTCGAGAGGGVQGDAEDDASQKCRDPEKASAPI